MTDRFADIAKLVARHLKECAWEAWYVDLHTVSTVTVLSHKEHGPMCAVVAPQGSTGLICKSMEDAHTAAKIIVSAAEVAKASLVEDMEGAMKRAVKETPES